MQAFFINIAKWAVTSIVLPLIEKAINQWKISKELAKAQKDRLKINKKKSSDYVEKPSKDTFNNIP